MKWFIAISAAAAFLSSCRLNSDSSVSSDRYHRKSEKEILKIAQGYAAGNITDSKKQVIENGLITISNNYKTYVIDPSKIYIGDIDQDSIDDAWVSLFPFEGNTEITGEHLIIISTNGKLRLIRTLESDMRIISISNGIITAEIPEHSRSSPLFNCPSCWEVVRYRFINGELIRIE